MRLGFYKALATAKSLSRIYPVQTKRDTGSRRIEELGFCKALAIAKTLVEFIPCK